MSQGRHSSRFFSALFKVTTSGALRREAKLVLNVYERNNNWVGECVTIMKACSHKASDAVQQHWRYVLLIKHRYVVLCIRCICFSEHKENQKRWLSQLINMINNNNSF